MDHSEISNRLAITELINRYADAVLRFDRTAFVSCWAEDAVWQIFGETLRGRQTITDFYMGLVGDVKFARHLAHSPQMRMDGESVQARWQVTENLFRDETGGILILGLYNDSYIEEDGAWRFATRRFDPVYRGTFEMDPAGIISLPPGIAGAF